jgi:mitochondrial import receptor subunit TOM40
MLIGRLMTDGRLNARVKCDLTENLALKVNAQVLNLIFFCLMTVILLFIWLILSFSQLTSEPHYSQGMFNFDYKVSICDNASLSNKCVPCISEHIHA